MRVRKKQEENGVIASPASVITLPRCTRFGCGCHGRGALVFLTVEQPANASLPEAVNRGGTHPCYPALHLRSRRSASANHNTSPAQSILYFGKPMLTVCSVAAHSSNRLSFLYDLATVPLDAFQIVTTRPHMAIVCLHQPPAQTQFEAALNDAMPRFITESEPGTIHSPSPLLLVQTGGWALGGFLAKISLLRCKGPAQQAEPGLRNATPGGRL